MTNQDERPIDDNAQNTQDYGSNVRMTDDPEPDDVPQPPVSDTHQKLDNASDIDSHQAYDEGTIQAAEANMPENDAVKKYNPENKSGEDK